MQIWNIKPERWPAGAPQALVSGTSEELRPLYGLGENGKHVKEWAFTDIDGAPTKSYIIENRESEGIKQFFDWALGKRPEYELFDITADPDCINNLSGDAQHREQENELKEALFKELIRSEDPRVVGPDPEVFDSYYRYSKMRYFPEPDNIGKVKY